MSAAHKTCSRWWVLKDDAIVGAAPTRTEAVEMIRQYQAHETHYLLRSEYSILYGVQEFVPYPRRKK